MGVSTLFAVTEQRSTACSNHQLELAAAQSNPILYFRLCFRLASSTCSFRAAWPWPCPTHPSVGQIRSIAGGRHHAQRASQQRSGIGDCAPPIRCSIAMYFCTLAGRPGPIILVQAPSLSLSNYSIISSWSTRNVPMPGSWNLDRVLQAGRSSPIHQGKQIDRRRSHAQY